MRVSRYINNIYDNQKGIFLCFCQREPALVTSTGLFQNNRRESQDQFIRSHFKVEKDGLFGKTAYLDNLESKNNLPFYFEYLLKHLLGGSLPLYLHVS